MKKILLLATGGTIASSKPETGGALEPVMGAGEILRYVPQVSDLCEAHARDIMFFDSSNIQPEEWQLIAREINAALDEYDGVVITHGTDTLAWTASACSYMLRNLDKPVIFTGAQLPIGNIMSDARRNLESSFAAAVTGVPGVYIVFDNQIIDARRARKLRSMGFNAFASINAPPAGSVDARGVLIETRQPGRAGGKPRELRDKLCPDVMLLKIMPGTKPELLDSVASLGYRGVVIEAFGVGGMHYQRRNLIEKIAALCERGILVMIISQCIYDSVDLGIYEVGARLPAEVISGRDMTPEAAVTLMMWALGQSDDGREARRLAEEQI